MHQTCKIWQSKYALPTLLMVEMGPGSVHIERCELRWSRSFEVDGISESLDGEREYWEMRVEVIEVLLLPKDDEHEQVKNEQFPWFLPLHSTVTAGLLSFSTLKGLLSMFSSRGLYLKAVGHVLRRGPAGPRPARGTQAVTITWIVANVGCRTSDVRYRIVPM